MIEKLGTGAEDTDFKTTQQPEADSHIYDHLLTCEDTEYTQADIEAAAVPNKAPSVRIETYRQMAIAAADRNNRKAAGLPPRVYDLR